MSQASPPRWRPVVEEIEPRILYSADFGPALLDAAPAAPVAEHRIVDATGEFTTDVASEQRTREHEVVFVDTATPDYRSLVADIKAQSGSDRQFDVVLLDPGTDGVSEISATLASMKDVSAVHLIGHGADGRIELGATTLNFESLLENASRIQGWGQALSPGADLLIYGCDVAQSADGRALIDALGRLTGAAVAASENPTGAAVKGGDWNLEYATGRIETSMAVSPLEQTTWGWLLDVNSQIASVAPATDPAPAPDAQQSGASADLSQQQATPLETQTQNGASTPLAAAASAQATVASLPLAFAQNVGQAGAELEFLAQGSGYAVGLAGSDALIALEDGSSSHLVRLDVVGKNANTTASGDGLLQAKTNYLVGSQDQWHTGIDNYGAVRYDNVYAGIDLRYYGNQRQLEYDFVVNAGADVNAIRLNFEGVQSVSIAGNGDLVLTVDSAGHRIFFQAPVAYQDGPDGRQAVSSHYSIGADGTVGFEVGAYDSSRQLVIDPVLSYGTYFGGTGNEVANGIAVDSAGNVYLTGSTQSTSLLGGLLGVSGGKDVFVAKFSPNLGSLIYSTYVGGSRNDSATSLALDASGNAYVTGSTSSNNFPTVSPFQSTRGGSQDAFVFKLNAAGSALTYSTYLGSNGSTDQGWAIAVDATGSAYVTGVASASAFPTTPGAADTSYSGGDAFVTKLTPAGNALVYSTFIGGSGAETGFGIAVDALGNAVVVGDTLSSNLPTTANAFQAVYGGKTDAFVTKLNSAGTAFTYSSYLGGNGIDIAYNLALDNAGKIYLTGQTSSTNFALSGNALKATLSGKTDAFVTIIDPGVSGAASLVYSTYLGGTKNAESGRGIGVDAGGRVYVAGQTDSNNFPVTTGAYKTTNPSGADAFLVVIDPLASASSGLTYGTYFGGSKDDYGNAGVYSNGKFYIAGDTLSTSGIATAGSNDTSYGGSGNTDAFAAIFNLAPTVAASSGALAYVENNGARVLHAGFTASDPGIANLAGATLQMMGGYAAGEDLLAFVNSNSWGITGKWNAASGTLALAGSSSVSNYQAAVRSVTYQNTSENPSPTTRSVTIVVNDGVLSSLLATRQITVTPVNDPPVNSVPGAQSTNEDTPLVFSSGNGNQIVIGDLDAGTGAVQVTLSVGVGKLTLTQTTGLTFVTGNGTGNSAMTFTGALANVNAAMNGLRFDPAADFNGGASLQIVINDQGNTGSGGSLTATSTVAIDVVAINDAPVNSPPGPQSTQTDIALVFSSANGNAISISDVDAGAGIIKVTLTPVNGALTLGPAAGLASVSIDGTGTLVLSGTLTGLNQALEGLKFDPTAGFSGGASLQIVTDDQGNTGIGATPASTNTVFISVTSEAAPTITTSGAVLGYAENAPATAVDPALMVSDPDSAQLQYAVVRIAVNYVSGEDVLDFTDQAGIMGSWDAATGTLTLTGSADTTDYQTALRSITYQNLSDDPSTATRSVWFVANDAVADSAIASTAIAVTAANDAPVNIVPAAQSVDEDTGLVFSAANGNAISIADPDAGNNVIQVVLSAANGTLSLAQISGLTVGSGADGTSTMTLAGTIDDINAALNGLRFDAIPDYNGAASVQIATSDLGSSGIGGPQLATDSVDVTVVAVSDAPQGADHTVGTAEDTAYTFVISDFGFGDAHDSPTNQLVAVRITTLLGSGSLVNAGVVVTPGQQISVADIQDGKLQFVPWANENGAGYASFTFQVRDDGNSANDLDPTARTMSIDVAAVDDSPQITAPSPQTTNEDIPLVFSTANGNAWTVDDIDADGSAVQVTLSVTNGTLALGGTAGLTFSNGRGTGDASMTFSGTLAELDAALDGLTYTPTAFYNGSAALMVGVDDLGNTGSGGPLGVLLSEAITITPVSSAPQGADQSVTVLEDGTYTFAVSDFGFSDAHDTPSNNLLGVQISAQHGAGLTDNGVALTAGQMVSVADISAGKLRFTPAANDNGAGYASFAFEVRDDGGIANGGVDMDQTARVMTVDVTAVDDAPVLTQNQGVTVIAGSSVLIPTSRLDVADVDNSSAQLVYTVARLPGAGNLRLAGVSLGLDGTFTQADVSSGNLSYQSTGTAGSDSFVFSIADGAGGRLGPMTFAITVDSPPQPLPPPPPPVATPNPRLRFDKSGVTRTPRLDRREPRFLGRIDAQRWLGFASGRRGRATSRCRHRRSARRNRADAPIVGIPRQ